MRALQQAVFVQLSEQPELVGRIHYGNAPVDTEPPYLEYWTGEGSKSEYAGFGEEGREYNIYVNGVGREADHASALVEAAERALKYRVLVISGWEQRGKITWEDELNDPMDFGPDNKPFFYEGQRFHIELKRQRTDI